MKLIDKIMWCNFGVWYQLILVYFVVTNTADVGDICTPNKIISDGVCKLVTDCEAAVRAIRNKNSHNFARCGFSGRIEIVCCPEASNKFGTTSESSTRKRKADIECDKLKSNPPVGQYIIGGEVASIGEFPHMVAIGFDRGNDLEFDCGGTLISNYYVLTAAHCVNTLDRIEPSVVRVGVVELGDRTINDDTDYTVQHIVVHPNYTTKEKYHDLALLRLSRGVARSGEVAAACVHTSARELHRALTVTGWGRTSVTRDSRSEVLLKAAVSVVGREACSASYTNWRKLPRGVSADQLCAGDPSGAKDTCQGDSGGPLQMLGADNKYVVVGITSFGRGCGSSVPGVYTRIANYVDWIEEQVWP